MGEILQVLLSASRKEIGYALLGVGLLIAVFGAVTKVRAFSLKVSGLIFLVGLVLVVVG
ncbi:MAG: hypothetical protein QF713_02475 [Dehalococcoidales bacterium]|nr:hypothetical protein [Dehalococcoidales bacterium]MDP7525188.1 hypothetical protein [Dehalococcoidales bacterium]